MNAIDALYTEIPYFGSRRMTVCLRNMGFRVNRKRVQRLMRQMGLAGMAPGPHTSTPHPEHTIYPYLLRGLVIERPGQVWSTDITYVRLKQGVCLPGRHHGLVQPQGVELGNQQHNGYGLLCRLPGGSGTTLRSPGDLQFGSGQPVYQRSLRRRTQSPCCANQHGRSWPSLGQCLCGAPVAVREVRAPAATQTPPAVAT